MIFAGIQKLTLLDFPAHTACTIFTKGCNFRCPFCHNFDLLDVNADIPELKKDDLMMFLKERVGKLEGIALTGGEVLLNEINELVDFLTSVRTMGYLIKVDTNGYFPEKIQILLDKKLVDYLAMDIKSGKSKYGLTCGIEKNFDYSKIEKSIKTIMNSNIDYEFRTTLVKGIHEESDFYEIRDMIKGANKYYFQNYRHTDAMPNIPYKSFLKEEILKFKAIIGDSVKECILRGIDG